MARTATDAGLARAREEREKRRKLEDPYFGPGNRPLNFGFEGASDGLGNRRAKMDEEYVAHSSSKDHVRPVEPEEDERNKFRISDSTGQKRTDPVSETSQSRAKAKAADPVGVKRKPSKGSEEAQSSTAKSKVADPTGENAKQTVMPKTKRWARGVL